MSAADEIQDRIARIEQEPDSRLKMLRLMGLRVLLASKESETPDA